MSEKKHPYKYELLLLLMSIIWGSTFVAQQIGMQKGLGPMTFNALRFALGAASLIPVMLWRKKNLPAPKEPSPFPLLGSFLAGLFLFAAASFQQVGLLTTSSANSGFITGLYILFVPLIGLAFGHKTNWSLWTGIAMCIAGFYFLCVTDTLTISQGDTLTLICAVLWAGQILVIDKIAKHGDPIHISCFQFVICAVLSGIAAILFETCSLATLSAGTPAVVYAGIMSVGIAFTLQVICQKRCAPAPAAVIMSMEAIFAAIAGYLVLDQSLTIRAILGCILILAGVLTVQLVPLLTTRRTKSNQTN